MSYRGGMTIRVCDLTAGDKMTLWDTTAIFITKCPHPLFDGLQLVVWWLVEEKRYSFDALLDRQELQGNLEGYDSLRKGNLRFALIEAPQDNQR